jgi:hypothetical protein
MKPKSLTLGSALALLLAATACSDQKTPTNPSSTTNTATSTSTSGATGGASGTASVSSTTPVPSSPADGAQIKNISQPVTLVVSNAVAASSATPSYGFEVASDSGFANKSYTKDGVAVGGNGQTSLTIDKLPAGQKYYWRAHLTVGGSVGLNSAVRSFTIGPAVTLTTPAPAAPGQGATVSGPPALTVNDVGKGGPAGQVFYRFELSDSSSFGRILFTTTVQEQPGQTSVAVPLSVIPANGSPTLYWHVQASDPDNGVTTPFSTTFSFVYQAFNFAEATMVDSPFDFPSWAVTSTITSIVFSPDAFEVDFDRRTSADRYGDVGFGSGALQYTLGGCFNINGHWYCSAVVQFWYGRELTASTPPRYVGRNWFYDARWGALQGHQPEDGELVGLFICPGNCRDVTDGSRSIAHERSNVALVPWVNDGNVTYSFQGGTYVASGRPVGVQRRR